MNQEQVIHSNPNILGGGARQGSCRLVVHAAF
jgi:hypothetical protein